MIGRIVGIYKIEEKIGEGGMGAVYRGVDTMLDREVAIKALRPELASQNSIVERFRSEAVTLAKLNHPNIATLYSLFRQGNELFMVLEFVHGETLDTIMRRRGALPAAEAIPVFCQVLDGIDHAHELGIVHRDIKPANMMLTERGTLKVLDFGIARLLGSTRMTRAGHIIGTLEYMPPEQVRGLETDARSDIYSLGMMLYEVLTGRLPFETANEFELMKLQTEQMPRPPRELNPAIPETVEEAIMRAIRKKPDERFQTAGDFCDLLLEAGLDGAPIMHGATGSFRRASTSRPPVSRPDEVSPEVLNLEQPIPIPEAPIRPPAPNESLAPLPAPTRLAVASPSELAIKMTRLGSSPASIDPVAESTGSFFSRLGIVHYVLAGMILLVIISGAVALPIIFLASGSPVSNTEVKTSEPERRIEEQDDSPPQTTPDSMSSSLQPTPAKVSEEPDIAPAEPQKPERRISAPRNESAPKKKSGRTPIAKPPKCTVEQTATGQC